MSENELKSIGTEIIENLTEQQVTDLLNQIFSLLNKEKIDEIVLPLDKDISKTVLELMYPKNEEGKTSKYIPSNAKCLELWNSLWGDWRDVISLIGNIEGPYFCCENHWEPPCFLKEPLLSAFDEISEKMLPLMDRIYNMKIFERDLFFNEFIEIEDIITSSSFYDYLGGTECTIYDVTTMSFLKWEWLFAKEKENPFETFYRRIAEIEERLACVYLNDMSVVDFVMSLPEDILKDIYDYITDNKNNDFWEKELKHLDSKWHKIYHNLTGLFNKSLYFETCKNMIETDWQYGIPLVDYYLEQEDYIQADFILEKMFSSLLKLPWLPEGSLIIFVLTRGMYKDTIREFLKKWIFISEAIGKDKRAVSLKLQLAVYTNPYDWEVITGLVNELSKDSYGMIHFLLNQWKAVSLKESLSFDRQYKGNTEDSWIHWLIDTGLTGDKDLFKKKVTEWLNNLSEETFKLQGQLIITLAGDMAHMSDIKTDYPSFFKVIIRESFLCSNELAKNRRKWLRKIVWEGLAAHIMECWKKYMFLLIPDPFYSHNSVYTEHARYLAVLKELNESSYREIIAKWKDAHKKRRNLWNAVREMKLPV